MSSDPTLVNGDARPRGVDVDALATRLVADVLMLPERSVRAESALIDDLGAESIDFLDLVFRLEDALGKKIPLDRWSAFVRDRIGARDPALAITVQLVREFARREATGS